MLLIDSANIEERRRIAAGPLAPLLASLTIELEPLLGRELYVPRQKALLSRAGGRCERDGSNLEFDPFSPTSHRCAICGTKYSGEVHERSWNTWYHLWLAERTVHASLIHVLTGDGRFASFARDILRKYADVYLTYPNRDNVLGPTRPFFSTYLESIWLLQLCVAADLLEHAGDRSTADVVRDRIATPSRELIAGFNEGSSNRQVWNNTALIASCLLLRDPEGADTRVRVKSGVADHLSHALLPDGTWFEGDNYHQFAIRGLWYAVVMCEANEIELSTEQVRSFDRGVAATFASALPDFTFPSRKDSQYAVSLRQWRFAELAELGYARTHDAALAGALARCYEPGLVRRDDIGRARSTADAERNAPSSKLTRADMGWRGLLHALPELPPLSVAEPRSVHLSGQGLAIFRRPDHVFVALDYGQSGAGHGHPDRLNLLLAHGDMRWLDDLGTGSYVEKSLHWYRSSLAHNAPFVGGQSQRGADGRLVAYDERGDIGWIEAQFADGGVKLTRTIVVTPGYLVDELAWSGPSDAQIDLPWHVDAAVEGAQLAPSRVEGGEGLEDGFEFAKDWQTAPIPKGEPVRLTAKASGRALSVTLQTKAVATLMRAVAPVQPSSKTAPFYMVRLHGGQGRLRAVVAWEADVQAPEFDGERIRVESPTRRDTHVRTPSGWRVETTEGRATKSVDLAGRVTIPTKHAEPKHLPRQSLVRRDEPMGGWWWDMSPALRTSTAVFELGEKNYRRSEESWIEAGSPSATVAVAATKGWVEVFIHVRAKDQRFAAASATNPFDNEHPDTMGAGVQLYATGEGGRAMWMLVPEGNSDRVRIREIPGSRSTQIVSRWRTRHDGYEMHIHFANGFAKTLDLDVVINDAVQGRERRRGQLVTADVHGEFVYLRGDREDESHPLAFEFTA